MDENDWWINPNGGAVCCVFRRAGVERMNSDFPTDGPDSVAEDEKRPSEVALDAIAGHVYVIEAGEWNEPDPELYAYSSEDICREHVAHMTRKPEWDTIDKRPWDDATVIARWNSQVLRQYIAVHRLPVVSSAERQRPDGAKETP